MHLYTEAWADSSRWRLLNGSSFMLDDGHLLAVQANPLLQFNQNAEMGLVVEMILYPDDDLQLALVKPSASIDFTTQADITYFGIIYERQFDSYYHQFVLNHRSAWGDPLLEVASPALDNLATYRLLFSASEGAVRVKIFDALDASRLGCHAAWRPDWRDDVSCQSRPRARWCAKLSLDRPHEVHVGCHASPGRCGHGWRHDRRPPSCRAFDRRSAVFPGAPVLGVGKPLLRRFRFFLGYSPLSASSGPQPRLPG